MAQQQVEFSIKMKWWTKPLVLVLGFAITVLRIEMTEARCDRLAKFIAEYGVSYRRVR